MTKSMIGWVFVTAQMVLLIGLILAPAEPSWPTPNWLRAIGAIVAVAGVVVMVIAALRLGTTLTPTPMPKADGQLQTSGLFAMVRHPIYTGVLATLLGVTIRSGSYAALGIYAATVGFFNAKAHWEEKQLKLRYLGYAQYSSVTPRFIPRRFVKFW